MATKKASSKKASKATSKVAEEIQKTEAIVKTVVKKESNSVSEISKPSFITAVVLEFIGTFLLAAAVIAGQGQPLVVLFALAAIVLIAGKISGAHVNPLITVGAWATRRISTAKALFYIVAQVLGAMIAFVILNAFVSNAPEVSQQAALYGQQKATMFTANVIPHGKELLILASELIGSFLFAFAVASVTSDKKKGSSAVAFGIGGGLFLAVLVAGSLSSVVGGSAILNPAVAFSLQAFTLKGQNVLFAIATYVGAALLGGILGFALDSLIQEASKEEK